MESAARSARELDSTTALAGVAAALAAVSCEVLTAKTVRREEDAPGSFLLTGLVLTVLIASPSFYDVAFVQRVVYACASCKGTDCTLKTPKTPAVCAWDENYSLVQEVGDAQRRARLLDLLHSALHRRFVDQHMPYTRVLSTQRTEERKSLLAQSKSSDIIKQLIDEDRFMGFAVGFCQRGVFIFLLAAVAFLAPHESGPRTRMWSCVFLAVYAPITTIAAFTSPSKLNKDAPIDVSLFKVDLTTRLGIATAAYASMRLAVHGFKHCDATFADQCMPFYESNSCAPACLACQSSTAGIAAFAGLIGAGGCKMVLFTPIGLRPDAAIPLFHAAAAQLVCALGLLLSFALQMSKMDVLFGDSDNGVLGAGRSGDEMRRFAQTNTSAGLCLFSGSAIFLCALVVRRSPQPGQLRAHSTEEFLGRYAACIVSIAAAAALVIASAVFEGWQNYTHRTFIASLCCILAFGVAGLVYPAYVGNAAWNGGCCSLASAACVAVLAVRYLAVCGMFVSLAVYFWNGVSDSTPFQQDENGEEYQDWVNSPSWNFFTNNSLFFQQAFFYCHLLCLLLYSCTSGCALGWAAEPLHDLASIFALLGSSIATVLYFCAAGLLAADDGTLSKLDPSGTTTTMLGFVHAHFLQAVPWVMLLSLNPGEFKTRWLKTNASARLVWFVAGLIPLTTWVVKSTGVPSEYPSPLERTTICALVLCGLLPWLGCSLLLHGGEA